MALLETRALTKDYGNGRGLFDFSMRLNPKDIVGLIGVNGAGKTTLLDMVSGKRAPDRGEIVYRGEPMGIDAARRRAFGISVNPAFYDYMTTYENLEAILHLNGTTDRKTVKNTIGELLEVVGLKGVEGKKIREFSFGMKQRLGFAQAILNAESVMLLDEPFVGLDIHGRNMVKAFIKDRIREKDLVVIFSDHNLDEVRSLCNRVIVIQAGRKVYDGPLDVDQKAVLKVASTESINPEDGAILDPHTLVVTEENLNCKLQRISRNTTITKIDRIINPLEEMLKEDHHVGNH